MNQTLTRVDNGEMASDKDDFNLIGPTHLTVVDWDNDHHRRSVAASLVGATYILERDRQAKRQGSQALAPHWWEFFHFRLIHQLVDDADNSIFGAVYEYQLKTSHRTSSGKSIPRYIIAFRGTLTTRDTVSRDLELDLHLIRNVLHKTSRVEIAMQAVRNTVASAHNMSIWLAGHSLGAAMGMLVGRNMAMAGTFLESFLFNPPYFSAPIEKIKDEKIKHGIRIAGSVVTAGLAFAMSIKRPQQKHISRAVDPFNAVSSWVPNLYVHSQDHLCSEYIGYFDHRKKMEELGVGGIGKLAAQHSLGGLVMSALGKESEPAFHLIPSGCLSVNSSPAPTFKRAHGLQQWWRPDLQLKTQVYLYD